MPLHTDFRRTSLPTHSPYGEWVTRWLFVVVAVLALAAPAGAADRPPAPQPDATEVLLSTQAVLHTADMISTAACLRYGGAREGNPWLAQLSNRPVALASVSGAVDVLQVYAILKLRPQHPRVAFWWSLALVATEVWTVTNNVQALGTLQTQSRVGR